VQLQATILYNKITPREALDLFGRYYPKRRATDELIAALGIPSVVELTFEGAAPDSSDFATRLGTGIDVRGDAWEIPTRDPKALLPRLLTAIEQERLEYDQVHVRRPTLEDVFLQLTGRSLRD
jgi:ABC-2 type transport system ATP-binding protein